MCDSNNPSEVIESFHVLIEGLQQWTQNQQLVEKAFAGYQDWLFRRGQSLVGAAKDNIQADFLEQYLIFRTNSKITSPRIITRLSLSLWSGECGVGKFDLITKVDGSTDSTMIVLDMETLREMTPPGSVPKSGMTTYISCD
ncbi:hypothetical protein [Nostoc sp. 106C]|uniref:hypothetical protein n=1 Tax=Nostoc sp. 106C TaxID=1932667 RepID=UPI000A39E543|nr:hypothetical protein [Nostoc sp. 106C]OUL30276.1 hypothetical protein BV375_13875 [Nostoc sp. 106C]